MRSEGAEAGVWLVFAVHHGGGVVPWAGMTENGARKFLGDGKSAYESLDFGPVCYVLAPARKPKKKTRRK